jgi:hypothetical protein
MAAFFASSQSSKYFQYVCGWEDANALPDGIFLPLGHRWFFGEGYFAFGPLFIPLNDKLLHILPIQYL